MTYPHFGSTVNLPALKVGDRVAWIVSVRLGAPEARLADVMRLTRTQVVVATVPRGSEYRFRRDDGRMMGEGGWGTYLLNPTDPEVLYARAVGKVRATLHAIDDYLRTARYRTPDEAREVLRLVRDMAAQGVIDSTNISNTPRKDNGS